MSYSGIPLNERRNWIVQRWLKEAFVAFAIIAVLTVGISKAVQHFGGRLERAKSVIDADDLDGRVAPAFKLPARSGGAIDLASLRGKTVLLNFWATWCPPCRDEMPSLEKLATSLDPESFTVIAVSVDDGWAPVEKFLGKPMPYSVLLDEGGRLSRTYGTAKLPESYVIDPEGHLRLKFVGPRDWKDPNVATVLESLGARRKPLKG